ncbi:hypothetical protein EDD11_003340 [Mortierella claussenii]|nr:hypothetical protein EDD11_003340 [Mortierella claussenii]
MTSQTKPRTQRYSAQIRALQNYSDADVAFYNYQQQQQQQALSPRTSHELTRSLGSAHYDHYPVSSSSNSAATTVINLTSRNSSTNALGETSLLTQGGALTAPTTPTRAQSDLAVSSALSSASLQLSGSHIASPPHPSLRFSTAITSALLKSSKPIHSTASPSQLSHLPTAQKIGLNQGQQHLAIAARHSKTGSVASVRSRLIAKESRSSLQLNLRTSQQSQYPTMITSPGGTGAGVWDEAQLAPSPLYPKTDPFLMSRHHIQQYQQPDLEGLHPSGKGGRDESSREVDNGVGGSSETLGSLEKQIVRMGTMSPTMNRQDDGRLQLEQERAYQRARKLRTWTRSKVILLLANTLLLGYSIACTVIMVMSWNGVEWTRQYLDSGIMMIANRNVLYVMMVAAPLGIFTAVVGYIGIFLQSRKVLAIYSILLWPLFALIASIGYICFRRNHVSLYQKLKFSWINEYTRDDRLIIQNALSCCGYRSVGDYPSYDMRCFPRAPLPACEDLFLQYQQDLLSNTSSAAFTIVPIQLLVMIVALLCSNHIDNLYRSNNPITPKVYTQ